MYTFIDIKWRKFYSSWNIEMCKKSAQSRKKYNNLPREKYMHCLPLLLKQPLMILGSILLIRVIIMSMNRTFNSNIISSGFNLSCAESNFLVSLSKCGTYSRTNWVENRDHHAMQTFCASKWYCTQRSCNYVWCFLELAFIVDAKSQDERVFIHQINTNSATSFLRFLDFLYFYYSVWYFGSSKFMFTA